MAGLQGKPASRLRTEEVSPARELTREWAWGCIRAPLAWRVWWAATERREKVVAVIDSDVDPSHPAIKDSLWCNPAAEGSRCIGDRAQPRVGLYGWDFVSDRSLPSQREVTTHHGSLVAGTITRMAPNARLMCVTWWREGSTATVEDLARAVDYALNNGAEIISLSGGTLLGEGEDARALVETFQEAASREILVVAASNNVLGDMDAHPPRIVWAPAMYEHENIICVTGIGSVPERLRFSWGKTSVDIAAPGVDILGPAPGNRWVLGSGASFAVPFVTGAAALLWGLMPELDTRTVRQLILEHARPAQEGSPDREWGHQRPATPNGVLDLGFFEPAYAAYLARRSSGNLGWAGSRRLPERHRPGGTEDVIPA